MMTTKQFLLLSVMIAFTVTLAACKRDAPRRLPDLGVPVGSQGNLMVIKSRAFMHLTAGDSQALFRNRKTRGIFNPMDLIIRRAYADSTFNQPVTVVNAPNCQMTIDNTGFVVPPISNSMADFGSFILGELFDNDLDICGDGTQHCGSAMLRMYTIDTAGPGMYNAAGGYGVPIWARQVNQPDWSLVGLDPSGAIFLQTVAVDPGQHVMTHNSFEYSQYEVNVDFSNAGAGTYETTLVIEYVLAL